MVRNFIKNISQRLKSAFSSKVFANKPMTSDKKKKTPKSYYKAKARQQMHAKKK